jgi:DNA-binding transcriptional ArsR family regulator
MRTELPVIAQPRMDLRAPDVEAAQAAASLLADRTRASVLRMLRDGPHCVCEMAAALGERENNVSNHLAKLREAGQQDPGALRDAGLVHAVRHETNGRFQYYERDEAAIGRARAALDDILQ